jgi:hypothetical protein
MDLFFLLTSSNLLPVLYNQLLSHHFHHQEHHHHHHPLRSRVFDDLISSIFIFSLSFINHPSFYIDLPLTELFEVSLLKLQPLFDPDDQCLLNGNYYPVHSVLFLPKTRV